jgi:hypothetical protein
MTGTPPAVLGDEKEMSMKALAEKLEMGFTVGIVAALFLLMMTALFLRN